MPQLFLFLMIICGGLFALDALSIISFRKFFKFLGVRKPSIEEMIAQLENEIQIETDLMESAQSLVNITAASLRTAHEAEVKIRKSIKEAQSDEIALPYAERLRFKIKDVAGLTEELANNQRIYAERKSIVDSKMDILEKAKSKKDSIKYTQKLKGGRASSNMDELSSLLKEHEESRRAESIVRNLIKEPDAEREIVAEVEASEARDLLRQIRQ
jgi:hypothetical protein